MSFCIKKLAKPAWAIYPGIIYVYYSVNCELDFSKNDDDVLDKGNLNFHALLMHCSEKIRAFISQAKIIDLLSPLAGPDIWVRWDQAVEKQRGAGTFPWHQDNQYSYLKDQHYQFWISMTSMTADNGGLWVV